MNRHLKRSLATTVLLGLMVGTTWAGGTHDHPAENGTAEAPLDIVRSASDTVAVTLTNRADSSEKHSVDFHAATAPGGGHFAAEALRARARASPSRP